MQETFKQENSQLFKVLLDGLHSVLATGQIPGERGTFDTCLELFLTTACNQDCNYCYLQKHKTMLYPPEFDKKEIVLNNLHILLSYYLEQGYQFNKVDLFSGEIWGYPYGNQVFDILLEYMHKGLKIYSICIPTNASFCASKDLIAIINSYVQKFNDLGASLLFSISYDGPVMDMLNRPNHQWTNKDKEYLDNLMTFMTAHELGFHPMISPHNIEKQIENLDAWVALIDKYHGHRHPMRNFGMLMQLETREHGWTDEKIIHYLKWLKHLIDIDLNKYFEGNKYYFEKYLNNHTDQNEILRELGSSEINNLRPYLPYKINSNTTDGALGCSLGRNLIVRVGDLAIIPCHRTCYPKFILGYYQVDDGKITDIVCENYSLANGIYVTGFTTKPFCYECALNYCCVKYCCGANYEQNQELFYPEESNCELQKAKMVFLYNYYKALGINAETVTSVFPRLKQTEPEVVAKWDTIIQSII